MQKALQRLCVFVVLLNTTEASRADEVNRGNNVRSYPPNNLLQDTSER